MKKLNKLRINSERLIKCEELCKIKGGYDNCCMCYGGFPIQKTGYMIGATPYDCSSLCISAGNWFGIWECLV